MEAIFRGGGISHTPVSPSNRVALDLESGQRAQERLLEVADVALHVLPVVPEVEDRVADELPGPVEGRLAAAVGLGDLDLGALGEVQLELRLGAPPDRDDRRVLEKDHGLRDRALRHRAGERALERERLGVGHEPEAQQVRAATHAVSVSTCVGSGFSLIPMLGFGSALRRQSKDEVRLKPDPRELGHVQKSDCGLTPTH